jgi:RNA 2',3'-cyclic 3'-phosphodiesterase
MTEQHSGQESLWRVFCAIEIPNEVQEQIFKHAEELREALPDVQASWTKPDNIHLTLKFFGSISQQQVLEVSAAASRTVEGFEPFQLRIEGAGAFPERGPARVLWIGINDSTGQLAALQRKIDDECEREGFEREARAFNPHLTVGRLRSPRGARALADKHKQIRFESADIEVNRLVVFRSQLGPKGSRYSIISEHPLT